MRDPGSEGPTADPEYHESPAVGAENNHAVAYSGGRSAFVQSSPRPLWPAGSPWLAGIHASSPDTDGQNGVLTYLPFQKARMIKAATAKANMTSKAQRAVRADFGRAPTPADANSPIRMAVAPAIQARPASG